MYVFKPDAEGGSNLSVSVMEVGCDLTPKMRPAAAAETPPPLMH